MVIRNYYLFYWQVCAVIRVMFVEQDNKLLSLIVLHNNTEIIVVSFCYKMGGSELF